MARKAVQFSIFDTTYHEYYDTPSGSPDSTPSTLSTLEQSTSRRSGSPFPHAIIPSPPPSTVETSDPTPGAHSHNSDGPSGSTRSTLSTLSVSPGPLPPRHLPTTQDSGFPSPPVSARRVRDSESLKIHKVLRLSLIPPINYNLWYSDEYALRASPALTPSVLAEAASIPPASLIIVTCEGLRFTITPKSSKRSAVVTVADVLHKLYRELRHEVKMTNEEYESLPRESRTMLEQAFTIRCGLFPEGAEQKKERGKGLKRIDYLHMKTRFLGFVYIGEDDEGTHWQLSVDSPYLQISRSAQEPASDASW